jgi:rare lipoprotein A
MIFLLAIFGVLSLNACMTSQTSEPCITALPARHDGAARPAIAALVFGFAAFFLAANPSAARADTGPAAAQPAPAAHFSLVQETEKLIERGKATWYGLAHSHHFTVSGERFDPTQLTAAHRSLPIGAMVRVTDRDTGRSVVVRVNDREPPHGARCIDLSEGAATALGIRNQGVANVTISAVTPDDAVEVAEAPDDAMAPTANAPHGRRHTRRAGP